MQNESNFIGHEPCTNCGSSDALSRYDDGHGYCFACQHYEKGDGTESTPSAPKVTRKEPARGIIPGSYQALDSRGITLESCKKWGYQAGVVDGQPVQLANYLDDTGAIIAQKVRKAGKQFTITGDKDAMDLYGKHVHKGKKNDILCINEGEIDAISTDQASGGQFTVVSIPNGAQSAKKSFLKDLKYIESFKKVVICFDMDEPGQKAALECAKLLSPGKAFIAELPLKDANEMLKAKRGGELFKAILNAKQFKPAGLVGVADVKAKVLEKRQVGLPWWDSRLTALTYGRRTGEIYMFGAGTGVGKTDWFSQQIEYDLNTLNQKVGVFFLEQEPAETVTRIAGKAAGHLFHVPDKGWTEEELVTEVEKLDTGNLHLYDHFGECNWENIAATIRYLHHAEGVTLFYVDHLTALAAAEEDEKTGLEKIMAQMGQLVKEIPIIIHCVSHLATPEGKPHEEGGRVTIRHFKGSRAIGFWSHYMFGLERNQQAEDPTERSTTTFRCLKDRYTGQATGQTLSITYDAEKGRLIPIAAAMVNPFMGAPNPDFS